MLVCHIQSQTKQFQLNNTPADNISVVSAYPGDI